MLGGVEHGNGTRPGALFHAAAADNQDVGNDFVLLAVVNGVRPIGDFTGFLNVLVPGAYKYVASIKW